MNLQSEKMDRSNLCKKNRVVYGSANKDFFRRKSRSQSDFRQGHGNLWQKPMQLKMGVAALFHKVKSY